LHTPTVKWLTFQTSYFVCVNHLETEVDVRRNSGCLFRNRNCKDVIKCTSLQAEILFRSRPDEVCTLYNVKSHYATLVSITYIVAVCKFGVKCVFFQHCLCNVRSCQNYTRISVEHAVDKTGAPNNCASYCVVCMSISHNVTVTQRCVQIVNKCTVCAVFGCCDCFDVVTTVQCSVCVVSDNFRQNRRRTVFNNALCKTRNTLSNCVERHPVFGNFGEQQRCVVYLVHKQHKFTVGRQERRFYVDSTCVTGCAVTSAKCKCS